MKKLYSILLVLIAFAQAGYAQTTQQTCEELQRNNRYPYYYCDCTNNAIPFQFPLNMEINDTTWFTATFNDIKQGLCAYWFADCNITFEIYAYCSSRYYSMQMTVGQNRMKEMDVTEINQKIAEAGQIGDIFTQRVDPVIRVYPTKPGESGRVLCYPYNEGPHSTCEDILTIANGMTFVRNETEDVYLLPGTTTRKNFGIRWKQEKDSAVTLFITRDSCNGELVAGPVTLTDSMHLWLPDSATMQRAYTKATRHPLYVHAVSHENLAGRLTFYTQMKILADTIDSVLCEGRYVELGEQRLRRDTTVYDTTYIVSDTIMSTRYNLSFTAPTPQNKTLNLKNSELPYLFEKQYYVRAFGKDTAVIEKEGDCTRIYYLTVNHKVTTQNENKDTTTCEGKTIRLSNITYSRDTVLRDTTMRDNGDTRVITTYTIQFTAPEIEYDTVYVEGADLIDGVVYQGKIFRDYGTYEITVTRTNTCTRRISITIAPPKEPEFTGYEQSPALDERRYKTLLGGQIIIVRQGERYNMMGEKIQ